MIKKGMQVQVIYGKDKGKKGEVIEILRSLDKAKVKGINIVKKHEKVTKEKKEPSAPKDKPGEAKKDDKVKKWN